MLTIGVEEKFFIVDPTNRILATECLPNFDLLQEQCSSGNGICGFDHEFQLSIVESCTGVCEDLKQVRLEIQALRRGLIQADVMAAELVPATQLLDRLLNYLHDALVELGDREEVINLADQVRRRRTSARRQRQILARAGRFEDVVDALSTETASVNT